MIRGRGCQYEDNNVKEISEMNEANKEKISKMKRFLKFGEILKTVHQGPLINIRIRAPLNALTIILYLSTLINSFLSRV